MTIQTHHHMSRGLLVLCSALVLIACNLSSLPSSLQPQRDAEDTAAPSEALPGPAPTQPAPAKATATTQGASLPLLVRALTHTKGQVAITLSGVAFSPDGKTLASAGGTDYLVKLWDVATGRELNTLAGHKDAVTSVAISPDGKIVASGSWDGTVRFWDAATGKALRTATAQASVNGIAFSPDGKTIASAHDDQTIVLWDVATGKKLNSRAANGNPTAIAFAPDGKTVASAHWEGTRGRIVLWDVATWKVRQTFPDVHDSIVGLAFSPDGKTLVSTGGATVTLWNASSGQVVRQFPQADLVRAVAYSSDGKMLAAGMGHADVVLDALTGKQLALLDEPSVAGDPVSVAFSPDGKLLAAVVGDQILLWNLKP